jgi:hypothetical protein
MRTVAYKLAEGYEKILDMEDDGNVILIHAEYQGTEAVFDLEGNLLEGEIPNKQRKYVVAWIDIHEEDLKANWKLLQEGQGYFKIQPLQ